MKLPIGRRSARHDSAPGAPTAAGLTTPLPSVSTSLVVGFVVVALGLSLLLFPSVRERALMHAQAGRSDRADDLLERDLLEGDRSPVNIRTLADLRAGRGDIEGAIALLTDPANVQPDDVAALRALVNYHRLGKNRAGRLAALERLQQLAPDASQARELAALYGEMGMNVGQRSVLRQLVMHGVAEAEPGEYLALARLQLADEPRAAADTLARLRARHPAAVDANVVAAQMSALCSTGAIVEAVGIGHSWIADRPERLYGAAGLFAGALIPGGHYDVAAAFLEPYALPDDADPGVIAVWAQAKIDSGDSGAALLRLQRAGQHGRADTALQALHLRLALAVRAFDDGWTTARAIGLARLAPADIVKLSEAALAAHRLDVLRAVLAETGDNALVADPLVAAKVHLALGDASAARRWSELAVPRVQGDPVRRVQLAWVELGLAERVRALASVRGLAVAPEMRPELLPELARLYIALGAAEEGFDAMLRARRIATSAAADQAWALTAAATGHQTELLHWLVDPTSTRESADFYLDLAHLAMDARTPAIAVLAARHLLGARGTESDRMLMAQALLAAGQPAQALPLLRALPRARAPEQAMYARAMLGAWREGEPLQAEVRALWAARLERSSGTDRDEALAVLVELGAYDTALPALATLAVEDPEHRLAAFSDAGVRSGQRGLLQSVWSRIGRNARTAPLLREQVAFQLLNAGDKPAADSIWRDLAERAPHDDPAVQRLLHLWGPRPSGEQIDWLAMRGRQAPQDEAAAWLRDLVRVGAPARAIAVHDQLTPSARSSAALGAAHLDALLALRDKPVAARALRRALADSAAAPGAAIDASQWRRWVELADFVGDAGLQRQSLLRWVSTGAAEAIAQQRLAALAYRAGDRDEAEKRLVAYEATTGGDLDSATLRAEICNDRGDAAGAQRHWLRALESLDSRRDLTFALRAAKARLLHRLNRGTEAAAAYDALLAERGSDANLRADYATLLLALGKLDQAQRVLERR